MFGASGNRFQKDYPVVFNLIACNIIVWLAQILLKNVNITELGSLHYFKSDKFYPFQVLTSFFLHDNTHPGHLFFNMVSLYFFGTMLERVWGSKRFFWFYMICGIGASILTQLTIPYSCEQMLNASFENLPRANTSEAIALKQSLIKDFINDYSALGASGAIMGVLAAAAYLFPNTPVNLMFIPIPIKLKYLTLLYVAYDLFGGINRIPGDNVGHFAHLGGALVGFLLVLIWNKTNKKTFY